MPSLCRKQIRTQWDCGTFRKAAGSVVADSSGRGHTGTFNSPAWTSGWLGTTGTFNGSTASVDLGTSNDFNVSGGTFTLEAWINFTTSSPNYSHVVSKWGNADTYAAYFFRVNGDRQPQFLMRAPGGNRDITSAGNLSPNTWYHIAVTFDGGNTCGTYVNGQQTSVNTNAVGGFSGTGPLYIGYAYQGGAPSTISRATSSTFASPTRREATSPTPGSMCIRRSAQACSSFYHGGPDSLSSWV